MKVLAITCCALAASTGVLAAMLIESNGRNAALQCWVSDLLGQIDSARGAATDCELGRLEDARELLRRGPAAAEKTCWLVKRTASAEVLSCEVPR